MNQVGRLQSVPLRRVWPYEARDFTVWLTTNLDVLGQKLGLSLLLGQV